MNWDVLAEDCLAVVHEVLTGLREPVETAARDLADALRAGGKVLLCGNGGSAADAQHMAGELVNRFLLDRAPYAAIALTADSSVLTSIGNDFDFTQVFEKQVRALGRPGDWLIGFSTSGGSANVCRAFDAARAAGIRTLAVVGGTGGRLAELADRTLRIGCTASTPRIQEGHQLLVHLLCERIEEHLA